MSAVFNHRLALGAILGGAVLVANCALPAAAVDESAGSKYTPDNVCALSVAAMCEARRACCNAEGVGYGEQLCISELTKECEADAADYKAGQMLFKPERLDACIKQAVDYFTNCGTFTFDDFFRDSNCTGVPFEGKRGEGAPCDRYTQCAPSTEPRTLVSCQNHRCEHYRYLGVDQPCQVGPTGTRDCDFGLYCDADYTLDPPWDGFCKAGIAVGEPCEANSNKCGLGFYCDETSTPPRCAAGQVAGATCSYASQCQSFACQDGHCVNYVASQSVCFNCLAANVTNVPTATCDLVNQDCASGSTCSVDNGQTACVQRPSGSASFLEPCATDEDCQDGLTCILDRCTKPCCKDVEYAICGADGACNLANTYDPSFTVEFCTYKPECLPWSGSCAQYPESECMRYGTRLGCTKLIADKPTIDKSCTYANECEDSQICYTVDTTSQCRWLCKYSDVGAPSVGKVGGDPGKGGCATGQTCKRLDGWSWLGVCVPG